MQMRIAGEQVALSNHTGVGGTSTLFFGQERIAVLVAVRIMELVCWNPAARSGEKGILLSGKGYISKPAELSRHAGGGFYQPRRLEMVPG